jgi:hypothetical protein
LTDETFRSFLDGGKMPILQPPPGEQRLAQHNRGDHIRTIHNGREMQQIEGELLILIESNSRTTPDIGIDYFSNRMRYTPKARHWGDGGVRVLVLHGLNLEYTARFESFEAADKAIHFPGHYLFHVLSLFTPITAVSKQVALALDDSMGSLGAALVVAGVPS